MTVERIFIWSVSCVYEHLTLGGYWGVSVTENSTITRGVSPYEILRTFSISSWSRLVMKVMVGDSSYLHEEATT